MARMRDLRCESCGTQWTDPTPDRYRQPVCWLCGRTGTPVAEPEPPGQEASDAKPQRRVCPVHGIPDCSPLLNGCSRLSGQEAEHG